MRIFLAVLTLGALLSCEHKKEPLTHTLIQNALCTLVAACPMTDAHFGMIGDSWTDFAAGLPIQIDLRDWLTQQYGYKIQSSTIGGLTAEAELNYVRGFDLVIRQSGPGLKYMLVSLGGDDLLANNKNYFLNGTDAELDTRLARLDIVHRSIIAQGDALKMTLWGGDPLTWIFSGYDYANPDLDPACVRGSLNAGMPQSQAAVQTQKIIDRYQAYLNTLPTKAPNVRVIDLRGTLGGPAQSLTGLKFDCIHPNDAGFYLLAARYAANLAQITPEK